MTTDSFASMARRHDRETAAASAVRAVAAFVPEVGVVTGSGLGDLSARVREAVTIPYAEIPGWPVPAVAGHPGELVLGILGGVRVAIARGRSHMYEGYGAADLAFGAEVIMALGATTLVLTNAAGGLNPAMAPGAVMSFSDHLFLPGLAGGSPLVGIQPAAGSRFPSMVGAYDGTLRRQFAVMAKEVGLVAHDGVYAMVAGPSFETPAEARMLRAWGADAVGMSTVPEVVVARQRGIRVLAVSVIANRVTVTESEAAVPATLHQDVVTLCGEVAPRLGEVLERLMASGVFAG
jgi:purine-nucleoside phosphorylase